MESIFPSEFSLTCFSWSPSYILLVICLFPYFLSLCLSLWSWHSLGFLFHPSLLLPLIFSLLLGNLSEIWPDFSSSLRSVCPITYRNSPWGISTFSTQCRIDMAWSLWIAHTNFYSHSSWLSRTPLPSRCPRVNHYPLSYLFTSSQFYILRSLLLHLHSSFHCFSLDHSSSPHTWKVASRLFLSHISTSLTRVRTFFNFQLPSGCTLVHTP